MRKIEDSLRQSKVEKDSKAEGVRAAGKRRLGGRPAAPGAGEGGNDDDGSGGGVGRVGEAGERESTRAAGDDRDASAASDGAYLRDSRFSLL